MTDAPVFEFAIPYAGSSRDYLRRAIESVRAQTVARWRLTVVNDQPRESDLQAYVAAFADARITYRRNAGAHGIGAAWNACLHGENVEYLMILHADDEVEPDCAHEMLALAGRHPSAELLFCNARIIDAAGAERFSLRDGFKDLIRPRGDEITLRGTSAIARLCLGNFVTAPTVVYRRPLLAHRAFSTTYRFVLDLDFVIDVLLDGGTAVGTAQHLFRYRRHAEQQTAVLDRDTARMDEEIAFYDALAARLRARDERATALLAALRLSTRLSGLAGAVADARAGRFAPSAAKLRRSLQP